MHIRCPHCHNAIEIVEDSSFRDVECPSCGSHFNLVGGDAPTESGPGKPRKLAHFELIEQLGVGHFGAVWKAKDTTLDRFVAVKIPRKEQLNEEDIEKFFREARAAAQLRHPNIVSVHEVGRERDTIFIASDYVEGATLAEWLRGQPLPPREAARLCAKIADALHSAHEAGVVHRDLKPQNIMMDMQGEPHIMDFGLAKRDAGEITVTIDGALLGTPAYMSPEQAAGKGHEADRRSDVYSLGVILFEMLTGELPFRGEKRMLLVQIQRDEPPTPRKLNGLVPRDLETICLKCLEKEAKHRYDSARALADDLNRFLGGDPVKARPLGVARRVWRWCKRRPLLMASALLTAVLMIASMLTIMVIYASHAVARSSERQAAVESLQRIQTTTHRDRWSSQAWQEVAKAAEIRRNADLRDQAFATLNGVDAMIWRHFELAATTVAFDADGKRVLFGGYCDANNDSAARLWNATDDVPQTSIQSSPGPVVFAADGSPWQIVTASSREYIIWDVARSEAVRTLAIPFEPKDQPDHDKRLPTMALTPCGELFAASTILPDSTATIAVWNTADGTLLRSFPTRANSLAFSPDAKWLAAGDEQGQVVVWSVATGEEAARVSSDELSVQSLAFGRDPRIAGDDKLERWILAVGDAGGTVTIWDLGRGIARSYCRGSARQIYDVEFSPDGVTLASCGRICVRLWDVASGRLLLEIAAGNTNYGLAFSPDGAKLAVTGAPMFAEPARADIYDLEFGRGVQTLRGLCASIGRVRFSRDGRYLAAVSNDWRVGVWDCQTGQLKRVVKVPEGYFEDNADMDISPDGQQLAFAAGSRATLWNVATGQPDRTWELPPGLQDQIRFCPDGKLLLFRFETKDGTLLPASNAHPKEHPRVCRVRDLFAAEPARPLAEINEFDWDVRLINATADGSAFCVIGMQREPDGLKRSMQVFNALDGKELWGIPFPDVNDWVSTDACGDLLALNYASGPGSLVDFRTGRVLKPITVSGHLSDQARYVAHTTGLWNGETGEELLRFDSATSACKHSQFSPDGKHFAWGVLDGSVFVCDVTEVLRRLSTVGLIGK